MTRAEQALVDEMAQHLVHGRQDPSDPEHCCEFLLSLNFWDRRTLVALLDDAIDAAGQIYIDRDAQRRAA